MHEVIVVKGLLRRCEKNLKKDFYGYLNLRISDSSNYIPLPIKKLVGMREEAGFRVYDAGFRMYIFFNPLVLSSIEGRCL